MLSVENLSIAHKNHQVLDDFNLGLESGEIFALLGDSGCGKSSALRFIAGLDSTTKGNVNLDGQSLTVDAGNLWYAGSQNLFQPVISETLNQNIPEHLRDPNGLWTGLSVRARTIVYNTERVKPSDLSTYSDLASAKWRGRLCLRTSKKIYTKSLVASILHHHGFNKTKKIVKGWVKNLAAMPHAKDSHVMRAIMFGQCDVGIVNTYYYGRLIAKKPDLPLKLFWANQNTTGVHVNVSGAGVTKHAKNPAGAIKLLEWLSAAKAQRIYGALNKEYPANSKVAADPIVATWGSFKHD